ncbi:energy-coupling factor transporter transmembrane component T [Okibacterium endophyticum]
MTGSSVLVRQQITGVSARLNPVAKLLAPVPVTIALLLTLDWVSAAVALAIELVLLAIGGVMTGAIWARALPVLVGAPLTGISMTLYGVASGHTYWQFGLIHVTEGSIEIGIATCLRVLAIALPAVMLFATIDPTDLADGLAQVVRLPARFVLGALAALRLVGLFIEDWRQLELARRARGVADRGRIRRFFGQAVALLVLSIRRGSKLATAMEARGFGGGRTRTWARASEFAARDWAAIALGVLVAMVAVGVSVATGSWTFVIGR